jgi:GTP-binding protein
MRARDAAERASAQDRSFARPGARPIVAIVGRPNVGKSALFNRLAGQRAAIVEDVPGVTRDRLYTDATALGRDYIVVDTGGFDPESDDPLAQRIAEQVKVAIAEADVVVCVFDGTVDPLPADREAVDLLRRAKVPVLYVANKIDNARRAAAAQEHYRLGIDDLMEISALHGSGIGVLERAIVERLPAAEPHEPELFEDEADEAERGAEDDDAAESVVPRVAIVGRPNAGKSSLVNRLLGKDRHMVDARPGTTVDAVDSVLERGGTRFILTDTAGIRRQRSIARGVESLAVMQAIRAVERSDTVVVVIDAEAGAAEQDTKVVGMALARGRGLVIALNKLDLLDTRARKLADRKLREVLSFAPWAPICGISARTGKGLPQLLSTARAVTRSHTHRVPTSELNRFFDEVLARHPPPTQSGRPVRLYYATQAGTRPPTFVISTNHPELVHFSYTRYVQNQIRDRFGFTGTPLRIRYKRHRK